VEFLSSEAKTKYEHRFMERACAKPGQVFQAGRGVENGKAYPKSSHFLPSLKLFLAGLAQPSLVNRFHPTEVLL
jgi:hypothetical protein